MILIALAVLAIIVISVTAYYVSNELPSEGQSGELLPEQDKNLLGETVVVSERNLAALQGEIAMYKDLLSGKSDEGQFSKENVSDFDDVPPPEKSKTGSPTEVHPAPCRCPALTAALSLAARQSAAAMRLMLNVFVLRLARPAACLTG